MFNILAIEDCPITQEVITRALSPHAHVICCATLADARAHLNRQTFDLVSLDSSLPDGDGFDFCVELRGQLGTRDLPIIFFTGKGEISSKVTGYSLGADDYIIKPIHLLELQARVASRLRRLSNRVEPLRRGDLVFHVDAMRVSLIDTSGSAKMLDLTSSEFRILFHLARNLDTAFDRAQLIDLICGEGAEISDRTIDKHISSIRQKLRPKTHYIRTINRCGYKFSLNP